MDKCETCSHSQVCKFRHENFRGVTTYVKSCIYYDKRKKSSVVNISNKIENKTKEEIKDVKEVCELCGNSVSKDQITVCSKCGKRICLNCVSSGSMNYKADKMSYI